MRERVARLAVLDASLVLAGLTLLLLLPRNYGVDGRVRYDAVHALTSGDLPHERYSLVTPLLATPLGFLGRLVGAEEAVTYRFNGVLFALGLASFWLLLRRSVSKPLLRSFLLLLVFGSMFPGHVTSLYGETTTALLLGVGLLAVLVGQTRAIRLGGWAAAVLGAVNTPAIIPAFALAVALLAVARRSAWPLTAVAAALLLALVDVRLHTGSFTSPYANDHGFQTVLPYSGRPGFSYPAALGILALTFSLGKGLLFYAPGLFAGTRGSLAPFAKLDRTKVLWLVVVVGMVAVYCRWWAWYGGVFFGPRFLLFASLPAVLMLSARLSTREHSLAATALTLIVLSLSVWVGVVGALASGTPQVCTKDDYALEFLCWYSPEFSALWRPLISWPGPPAAALAFVALAFVVFVRLAFVFVAESRSALGPRVSGLLHTFRARQPW
jgi:hypothetical protein